MPGFSHLGCFCRIKEIVPLSPINCPLVFKNGFSNKVAQTLLLFFLLMVFPCPSLSVSLGKGGSFGLLFSKGSSFSFSFCFSSSVSFCFSFSVPFLFQSLICLLPCLFFFVAPFPFPSPSPAFSSSASEFACCNPTQELRRLTTETPLCRFFQKVLEICWNFHFPEFLSRTKTVVNKG